MVGGEMQGEDRGWRGIVWVLGAGVALHGTMLIYDAQQGFAPLLRGDRGYQRWDALTAFQSASPGHVLDTMVSLPVAAGEYLLPYPAYALGGRAGIVIFQIALFLLSLLCVCLMARRLFRWRPAAAVCGVVYLLLPHNLAFTHQLVTEAFVTPFMVFFAYFYFAYLRTPQSWLVVLAGFCLGVAIFSRPAFAIVAPAVLALHLVYFRYAPKGGLRASLIVLVVAALPLGAWAAVFTAKTGAFGYTAGVVSLGWNLRSKVFLVHTRNGIDLPPEVARFKAYGELYEDTGGISVGRFLQIASRNPAPFLRSALTDAAILGGRGNLSKVVIDYFGVGREDGIKDWRDAWSNGGVKALFDLVRQSAAGAAMLIGEGVFSLVTGLCVLAALVFCLVCAVRPARIVALLGAPAFGLILVETAILAVCFLSAQMVDQAQARLRHPSEAGLVLLLGLACAYLSRRRSSTA